MRLVKADGPAAPPSVVPGALAVPGSAAKRRLLRVSTKAKSVTKCVEAGDTTLTRRQYSLIRCLLLAEAR
jgi:hypothetical protein